MATFNNEESIIKSLKEFNNSFGLPISKTPCLVEKDQYKLNSNDDFFYQKNYIKIANTHLTAHVTVHKIVEAFEFEEV